MFWLGTSTINVSTPAAIMSSSPGASINLLIPPADTSSNASVPASFKLSRDEVLPLLTRPIAEFDLTYAPEALDALLDATAGQPFLTQATAYELVNWMNRNERKQATVEDVRQAIDLALDSGAEYFANVWHDAGDDGRAVLHALVTNQPPQASPTVYKQLREQEILDNDNRFLVPMVQTWIHRRCLDLDANLPP